MRVSRFQAADVSSSQCSGDGGTGCCGRAGSAPGITLTRAAGQVRTARRRGGRKLIAALNKYLAMAL